MKAWHSCSAFPVGRALLSDFRGRAKSARRTFRVAVTEDAV